MFISLGIYEELVLDMMRYFVNMHHCDFFFHGGRCEEESRRETYVGES